MNNDNVNWDQNWYPYDPETFQPVMVPLHLPPGKVYECDVKIALGNWAHDNKMTNVGAVSEDMSISFEIRIKPNPDNPKDWVYES